MPAGTSERPIVRCLSRSCLVTPQRLTEALYTLIQKRFPKPTLRGQWKISKQPARSRGRDADLLLFHLWPFSPDILEGEYKREQMNQLVTHLLVKTHHHREERTILLRSLGGAVAGLLRAKCSFFDQVDRPKPVLSEPLSRCSFHFFFELILVARPALLDALADGFLLTCTKCSAHNLRFVESQVHPTKNISVHPLEADVHARNRPADDPDLGIDVRALVPSDLLNSSP